MGASAYANGVASGSEMDLIHSKLRRLPHEVNAWLGEINNRGGFAIPLLNRDGMQFQFRGSIHDPESSDERIGSARFCRLVISALHERIVKRSEKFAGRFTESQLAAFLIPEQSEIESTRVVVDLHDGNEPRLVSENEVVVPGFDHRALISIAD